MPSLKHVERALQVFARVNAERDERVGAHDARHTGELFGHYTGDVLPLGHAQDSDQIPITGHRIDFCHTVDFGDGSRRPWDVIAFSLDEHDGGDHETPPLCLVRRKVSGPWLAAASVRLP